MSAFVRTAIAAATFVFSAAASAAPTQLISNGDFSAGLSGWTVVNQANGSGDWYLSTVGSNTPVSSHSTSGTGGSGNYAVTDQTGPGSHVLFQNFTVGAGASSVIASFSMFANDWSNVGPINAGNLNFSPARNQHARVDILKSSANAFSVSASDIIATLIAPMVDQGNDPHDFLSYSFDITSAVAAGGSFMLRFAEVDNQSYFNVGIDNVSVLANTVPEPMSLALVGGALLGLAAARRTRRA
ncbi:MAG: PEP-CTERM sorting domain-containing protein [Burkholderiales bacterium]|nr:MAG: PEP-CTERM sorting domain-containing protein [Burkholderiales bacterium]